MSNVWLAHHGILGQKWGIRRFQKKDGTYTPAGKKRYSKDGSAKDTESEASEKQKFWTDERKALAKKIAIGTAVVAGVALASYGTYKLYQDGKLNPIIDKFKKEGENNTKEILGNGISTQISKNSDEKDFKLKRNTNFSLSEKNVQECCANVNPDKSGTNCGACSIASFLKTEGYEDVFANGKIPDNLCAVNAQGKKLSGLDPNKIKEIFKGAVVKDLSTVTGNTYPRNDKGTQKACERMTKELLKYGEGAGGLLWTENTRHHRDNEGNWVYGPGHYCAWRIISGKLHILEGQPSKEGIVWTNFYDGCGRNFDPGSLGWTRLDGLEINEEALQGLLRNKA